MKPCKREHSNESKSPLNAPTKKKRGAIRNFIVQESEINSLRRNQRRLFVPLLYRNVTRA